MGTGAELVDSTGKPLLTKMPSVVVLKHPKDYPLPSMKLIQAVANATRCNVLILPMEYELMQGELAMKEIAAIHKAVHMILDISAEDHGIEDHSERKN